MKALRCQHNPIISSEDAKPSREDFEVIGVFNPGVARLEGEVALLFRVAERPINKDPDVVRTAVYDATTNGLAVRDFPKGNPENDFSDPRLIKTPGGTYLTSISHLRLARSRDGIHFEIDDKPALSATDQYEAFGLEDPRISLIDGRFYVSYVAVSEAGIVTALASTRDFESFERHGVIFCPDNKDVAVFPERIGGRYYAFERPVSGLFGRHDIWLAESPDLRCWGNHRRLMATREELWDEAKVGAGAVPVRTDGGWLEVYHGSDRDDRYCLGAVLLDSRQPWKVIARAEEPIFEPEADYEVEGFFGNVVFSCGLLCEEGLIKLYYGAADTSISYAELALEEVLASLRRS
jgi:predicted GH43/DUF377 family glycosyl hydrolase